MRHPTARLLPLALSGVLAFGACVNFHAIEPERAYRSSQPNSPQLAAWIWRYRIETVLRLNGGGPGNANFDSTYGPTADAGIDFVQVPMSASRFPEPSQLLALCHVFATARYPLLIHCRAGADRTGLASAIYVLERTGDLARARAQLSLEYWHVGIGGTERLDQVLDLYEPYQQQYTFCEWVRQVYQRPPHDTVTPAYVEALELRARAAGSDSTKRAPG